MTESRTSIIVRKFTDRKCIKEKLKNADCMSAHFYYTDTASMH